MGKSHQAGWVVLRGKQWYGYFRRHVLDPTTQQERADTSCIKLGLRSQMTRSAAREALRTEITKQTGQNIGGRVLNDSSVNRLPEADQAVRKDKKESRRHSSSRWACR
jgi:hypothetical protein